MFRRVTIHWKDKNGQVSTTPANLGASLLEVAHKHGIDLEGILMFYITCYS